MSQINNLFFKKNNNSENNVIQHNFNDKLTGINLPQLI